MPSALGARAKLRRPLRHAAGQPKPHQRQRDRQSGRGQRPCCDARRYLALHALSARRQPGTRRQDAAAGPKSRGHELARGGRGVDQQPAPARPPLAPPVLNPAAGTFTNSVGVTVLPPDANATVYYTLDGSLPTTGSSVYSGPIILTNTAILTANAFESGSNNSVAVSGLYILDSEILFTSPGSLSNGVFQLTLSVPPGRSYVLQASTNFTQWVSLSTNTPAVSSSYTVTDPKAGGFLVAVLSGDAGALRETPSEAHCRGPNRQVRLPAHSVCGRATNCLISCCSSSGGSSRPSSSWMRATSRRPSSTRSMLTPCASGR